MYTVFLDAIDNMAYVTLQEETLNEDRTVHEQCDVLHMYRQGNSLAVVCLGGGGVGGGVLYYANRIWHHLASLLTIININLCYNETFLS